MVSRTISDSKTSVVFTFNKDNLEMEISELVKKYGNRIKFSAGIKPMITLEIDSTKERKILNDVTELVKDLQ